MSPSIPFLRLPNDPQLLILEYLSLYQLFAFSFLSKKAAQIAKSGKRNIKEFGWKGDYRKGTFRLRITDYEDNAYRIHIPLYNRINITGEIALEGRKLRKGEDDYERGMSIGKEDQSKEERLELFEKLTEHSLAMLNVENYSLWMENTADLTNYFMWKYTKTLEKLCVHAYEVLTASEMEFILGELTVTDSLRIDSNVAEGFQWREPLKTRIILLEDGLSLSLNVYLNSKVEQWLIYDRTFPTTHLNAIMKKWLDGGLERLKSFRVECSMYEERGLNEALEGIQTVPWDRRTRQRTWNWIDTSEGRDMRRSDGKLATALVDDSFCFFVWESDQLQPESDSSDEDDDHEED